jgi:dihydrofolate synthase/folylpolyglutamate synthase
MNGEQRPTRSGAPSTAGTSTRQQQAEGQLRALELFGMRFGLDRMRRMMTVLGSPERSFEAVHVLGTNGKSSTTRMTGAILERHGLRTGAYLSPHLVSYCERVLVEEREMDPDGFADAVSRAAWAAERVNRTLAGDDHVTQFELLTAAAFWHMAAAGVEVAVVEAGLGGRYDATSVLDAPVTVLTNVGLEHTRWLGPTVRDIAEEKLAAVSEGAVLVLGEDLDEQAMAVAERVAGERGARIVRAGPPEEHLELAARGAFQRRNFALARAAAGAYLEHAGIAVDEQAILAAAAATAVPGRLQVLSEDPVTILDGAHNPHAVDSLLRSLPEMIGERPLGLVLGVLEDKDAAGMLEGLLARAGRAWFVAPPGPRALPPATLHSLARQLGFTAAESGLAIADALEQAQQWAREHDGAVLVTGSVYLVGEVLSERLTA